MTPVSVIVLLIPDEHQFRYGDLARLGGPAGKAELPAVFKVDYFRAWRKVGANAGP